MCDPFKSLCRNTTKHVKLSCCQGYETGGGVPGFDRIHLVVGEGRKDCPKTKLSKKHFWEGGREEGREGDRERERVCVRESARRGPCTRRWGGLLRCRWAHHAGSAPSTPGTHHPCEEAQIRHDVRAITRVAETNSPLCKGAVNIFTGRI